MLSMTRATSLLQVLSRRQAALRAIKGLEVKSFSSSPTSADNLPDTKKINVTDIKTERQMSSAMRMYLKRKRQHDIFISKERTEFDLGRQHLANMMGYDPDTMSQDEIDKSIEYLFPSGLSQEARPVMKPPEEIFPKEKDVEFNLEGRPFHPFFYTLKPNFNRAIFTMRDHIEGVTIFGDRLRRQGKAADSQQVLNLAKLADSRWATQEEMQKKCLENISDIEYKEFILVLERLVNLPFSYRVRDEIFQWRVKEVDSAAQKDFLAPQLDGKGRAWVEVEGKRKTSVATVRVSKPGTGQVEICHQNRPDLLFDISYFYALKDRHQLLFPLQFSKMLGLVDLRMTVGGGGPSGQAGAARYAIAMALRSFVDKRTVDEMKLVGLLTQDIRVRERKKPGKVSARKSYTWKRR